MSGLNDTREVAYATYFGLAVLFSAIGLWLMQASRRDHHRIVTDAAAMQTEARHANLETSLQRALDMEPTEERPTTSSRKR